MGTGPGTRPGIPAPAFFDGAPPTPRPREGPTAQPLLKAIKIKAVCTRFLVVDLPVTVDLSLCQNNDNKITTFEFTNHSEDT